MNARGIAQEVVSWYFDHLDPCKPHCSNVKHHLRRPVLALTRGVLMGLDNTTTAAVGEGEEEKKCGAEGVDTNKTHALLDKASWGIDTKDNQDADLYESLGRRDKARLEAFLTGVEIAVPSVTDRTPNLTPTSSASSSSLSSQEEFKANNEYFLSPRKQFNQSSQSPVLTSLNHRGKALLRSVSITDSIRRNQPQIREHGLLIRLELYIRSLYRVRSLGRPCVIAVEPDRAIKARAGMIVASFVSTVGCVRAMTPVLQNLLVNLTKELLAAEFVGEELHRVIRRIVNEYEHGTSFASLAFLSTPEASAENRLTPMILKYIHYLQSDWKNHEMSCEIERMLACSLDGDMRLYLKTVEFSSIGHTLEVCQGFRNELQNIELAPTSNGTSSTDLCNNPDAVRQAITDLQREIITINGHVMPPVSSRQDLINLLSQSLNSRSLTPVERSENFPAFISTAPSTTEDDTKPEKVRRASFHLSTVDLLTRRLLIAASRTGTGGDAYFIVRDLFGDEDVEVVPAKHTRVGSIEIQVRLASVTIKCHGSFDIYPKSLVGSCEPLIQFHTTTTETIYLQELRSCDSNSEDGLHSLEDDGSRSSDGMENLVLQEKQTSTTGRRILSIRPALYEKVEVWNTLS